MAILTPVLTVADQAANPSSVLYSISGGSAGATNVLNAGLWVPGAPVSFAAIDTQTGNVSNVSELLAAGYYWFYVQSTLGAETTVSNFVFLSVTNPTASALVTRLLTYTAGIVTALNLTGIGSSVYIVPNVHELSASASSAYVMLDPLQVPAEQYSSSSFDVIRYTIQICFTAVDDLGVNSPQDKYALWLQKTSRAFRNGKPGPTFPEVVVSKIVPALLPVENRPAFYDLVQVIIAVSFDCREPRGFGA